MKKYMVVFMVFAVISVGFVGSVGAMQKGVSMSSKGEFYKQLSDLENEKYAILVSAELRSMPENQKRLKEINNEINTLKALVGDSAWSSKEKTFAVMMSLFGASAIGVQLYFQWQYFKRSLMWN